MVTTFFCRDNDGIGVVYDLDASSDDGLKSSFNEMIDGIEVTELGILLMVTLDQI